MANYIYKPNTQISIFIEFLQTVIRQDRRLPLYLGCIHALLGSASFSSSSEIVYLTNLNAVWGHHHCLQTHIQILSIATHTLLFVDFNLAVKQFSRISK